MYLFVYPKCETSTTELKLLVGERDANANANVDTRTILKTTRPCRSASTAICFIGILFFVHFHSSLNISSQIHVYFPLNLF